MDDLEDEASRVTTMLRGKHVDRVLRHRASEVAVQFADGTRLFVDTHSGALELSITEGAETDPDAVSHTPEPSDATDRPAAVAELLTPPHNYAVVQLPDRRYPGVVLQGDSLSTVCRDLARALGGDENALAVAKDQLDEVLRSYIATLEEQSIEPPFSFRPDD